jgi:hypothetical protein
MAVLGSSDSTWEMVAAETGATIRSPVARDSSEHAETGGNWFQFCFLSELTPNAS